MNDIEFLIIDDDAINNDICELYIQIAFPGRKTSVFTSASEGINYIRSLLNRDKEGKTILLLDINMPTLSGWDVINEISGISDINKDFLIYILSSSVAMGDKALAHSNSLVTDFIEKPLSVETLGHVGAKIVETWPELAFSM